MAFGSTNCQSTLPTVRIYLALNVWSFFICFFRLYIQHTWSLFNDEWFLFEFQLLIKLLLRYMRWLAFPCGFTRMYVAYGLQHKSKHLNVKFHWNQYSSFAVNPVKIAKRGTDRVTCELIILVRKYGLINIDDFSLLISLVCTSISYTLHYL